MSFYCCDMCGSPNLMHLGALANRVHCRCRDCGSNVGFDDFSDMDDDLDGFVESD